MKLMAIKTNTFCLMLFFSAFCCCKIGSYSASK